MNSDVEKLFTISLAHFGVVNMKKILKRDTLP